MEALSFNKYFTFYGRSCVGNVGYLLKRITSAKKRAYVIKIKLLRNTSTQNNSTKNVFKHPLDENIIFVLQVFFCFGQFAQSNNLLFAAYQNNLIF